MIGSGNPLSQIPVVVKNLLIINLLMLLLSYTLLGYNIDISQYLGLHFWRSDFFEPFQLITYMFLHSTNDFGHLFFNMFSLWMFGRILEPIWGPQKFLLYYLLTGVGAAITQLIFNEIMLNYYTSHLDSISLEFLYQNGAEVFRKGYGPSIYLSDDSFINALKILNFSTVGASGAVFGILMAFGMLFPNVELMLIFPPIPIKGKYIAILALVLGVFLDTNGNVAHFAHLGGMLFGYILIKMWKKNTTNFY